MGHFDFGILVKCVNSEPAGAIISSMIFLNKRDALAGILVGCVSSGMIIAEELAIQAVKILVKLLLIPL